MSREKLFSANLCALMEGRGMSVRQAAKAAGVSLSTIQSWRTGSSPNDYLAVRRLAIALGTTLTWLLTGEHEDFGPFDAQDERLTKESRPFFSGYAYVTVHRIKKPEEPSPGHDSAPREDDAGKVSP